MCPVLRAGVKAVSKQLSVGRWWFVKAGIGQAERLDTSTGCQLATVSPSASVASVRQQQPTVARPLESCRQSLDSPQAEGPRSD